MVIQLLFNHNFLQPPEDHDILAEFSSSSKRLIALEVVETLSQRYLDAVNVEDSVNPVSSSKTKVVSLPVLLEPFPSTGNSLWKLPTWKHVKWVSHSIAPVFSLPLDSLNSISNAVKIYCLWLKNPKSRPVGVSENNLEEFISFILLDISELFEPRKGSDIKSALFTKRHAELCHQVIKTIVYDLVPNSPLFSDKASKSWDLLTRLLLGITDNLLWSDKQNYLADDLTEVLLNSLFFVFLQGGMYSDELWKRFASCFKLWCHRLKSVLVWGSVIVSLTAQVAKSLYADSNEIQNLEIVYGLHSAEYRVSIDTKFANYSWTRITNFLPKINTLPGDIFLRALQSLEKVLNIWLSAGTSTIPQQHGTHLDRKIPNVNTLLEIYGEMIFDAAAVEKATHENGRAIAISLICRILSKWQYREEISDSFLSVACASLKAALQSDLHAVASALYNMESFLVSGHSGILCLAVPIFMAIRRILPKGKIQKSPLYNISHESLRMCCYRLLSLIYSYFSESCCPINFKNVDWTGLKPFDHSYSLSIFQCYSKSLKVHAVFVKAHLLDTLIISLNSEDTSNNIRFLLNYISAVLYTDYKEFPELFPVLLKIFENLLCKPPTAWSSTAASLVDTQITIVRIIEQWSRLGPIPLEHSNRLCTSFINVLLSSHSKSNLPLFFRLMVSIYDALFSWLSVSGSPIQSVSSFISALVKIMNDSQTVRPTKSASQNQSSSTANIANSPASPSLYGVKNRKSLSERVFTLELGSEDPRPGSISPTLLKGVDEIFMEYTDSVLQKLLGLLLQDQINTNYPVRLDADSNELDSLYNIKYFALASSIIVGFAENLIFVRNSIGKFIWKHEYKISDKPAKVEDEFDYSESGSILLDLQNSTSHISPFRTSIVVTDIDHDDPDVILNDYNWTKSLNNNKSISSRISPILNEVANHVSNEIIPELPRKSRLNRVRPQKPLSIEAPEIISRLFLTHLGFLNVSTYALICPLTPKDMKSLTADLKNFDELSCREAMNIPVYFIPGNYHESTNESVSKSFELFVKGLGGFTSTAPGPIYADSSVEVTFPVIFKTVSDLPSIYNESISILWSEDSEILMNLPPSNSNFVNLLITPILINGEKGNFFRIRILLARTLQPEFNSIQSIYNSFGPILDGMIVKKSVLSQMVRETSIFAHRFISQYIENSPNPIMRRQSALKSIIFKNYQVNTYGSQLKSLL